MKGIFLSACTALVIGVLSGCVATTTMSAAQGGTTLEVKTSDQMTAPRTEKFATTSFGNYEFRAASPGYDPFTGILPLKFNGGYLALDILFFAPAMFFNLREVYAFYEFDLDQRVVKYKKQKNDEWQVYVPRDAEAARARNFYGEN